MNGLVALAAEFLERVADPRHGLATNDLYGARLEWALDQDEHARNELGRLELGADDVSTLTVDAWLWYLRWRSERYELPADAFLEALFEATDEPAAHARILEAIVRSRLVTGHLEEYRAIPDQRLENLPVPWLPGRLLRDVERHDSEEARNEAWALATYLLQLGDPASMTVLAALVGDPRARQMGLAGHVVSMLENLDEESRRLVLRDLRLEE